jgi:beta-lactamase regulating signal transducer with metallopeptidase domain
VVLVWFLGAIVSTLPLISGCIRLRSLKRLATPMGRGAHRPMAAELSRKMGIRRGITLLQSNQCMVPFTCGVFRPLIILPADLSGWPLERLRAVMRHEMAHVKQGDYLVKLCARAVCSLFWYVPFAWVAYANLHAEQEKACDASIVESGDDPALYAHELVEIARAARKRPLGACIFMSREKSGLLKKRILSILESGGGKKMKKKTIPYVMVFLVVALAGIGSFAADREKQGFYVPKPSEEIYGTWINKEYSGDRASRCQKIVLHNWGYGEKWLKIEDEKSKWSWTYFFAAKWTDSDGNIWYKGLDQFPGWPVEYSLTKISKNGAVMECIYSRTEFPSESDLDPSHLAYLTYYRK